MTLVREKNMRFPRTSGCINSAKVCEQLGQGKRNVWQQPSLSLYRDCCKENKAAFSSYLVPEKSAKCIAMALLLLVVVAYPACAGWFVLLTAAKRLRSQ